ncbi:MAG: hypothetical protein J6Z14_06120 [Prevotella sp.]|nr:hypothetical protein [Prevotella sp.]
MNRLQLFRNLRRHNKLAFRRNPAYDQSVVAKVLMVIGAGITAVYMIFAGTMFGSIANESGSPGFLLFFLSAFLLEVDFISRFMVQKTPAMLVKPYMLLPLPRRTVVDTFLLTSLASGYNWLWLALFLPYAFIIFCGGTSLFVVLTVLASCIIVLLANSQFYLLVRTLIARSLLWWVLPLFVYGIFIVGLLLIADENELIEDWLDNYIEAAAQPWFTLLCLLLLAGLLLVNRTTQYRFAFEEIARESKKPATLKSVSNFTFLERFGQMGEYLKLELKSIMRNKAIRARVFMSLGLIVVFTLLIAYTDIYDGRMMLNFWCFYCFSIYGMTALIKVMGPEGNYIDLLMVHRENILQLLRAKYYFHVAILLVPLLLMLPAIIAGKFSVLMVAAYMLLSSGYLYFLLFQMAVYNKQTLPLDSKVTGKNSVENGLQLVVELLAMLSPLAMVAFLILIFDEQTAYWVLLALGLVFTLAHPYWLRNIYHRMMVRKYENLEGFHASR